MDTNTPLMFWFNRDVTPALPPGKHTCDITCEVAELSNKLDAVIKKLEELSTRITALEESINTN